MTKLERLIEEARKLPEADRLRLLEEVERSVQDETDGIPRILVQARLKEH